MDVKLQAIVNTLMAQRNEAMNVVAELNGLVAERDAKIAELVEQLKPKE